MYMQWRIKVDRVASRESGQSFSVQLWLSSLDKRGGIKCMFMQRMITGDGVGHHVSNLWN